MNAGSITEKIFNTARELVGWIPGGLGHANIIASVIFAGMSGSAVADAGGLGAIEMEAMKSNGYDEDFAGAVTAASSVIGPIFPPSIPLIIYGSVASVQVERLFMGGVVPGLLMGVLLMVLILIFAILRKYERHSFNLVRFIKQFLYSIPALGSPLIILSGFTLGWFTPTEASSIAVVYSLLVALFVYRSLGWKDFLKCLKDSAISSANTLFIIGTATLFTYVMAMEGISRQMADFILGVSSNPNVILLVINVLLLCWAWSWSPAPS
jgi:tripartite ATP-independent transporter DctM subunit